MITSQDRPRPVAIEFPPSSPLPVPLQRGREKPGGDSPPLTCMSFSKDPLGNSASSVRTRTVRPRRLLITPSEPGDIEASATITQEEQGGSPSKKLRTESTLPDAGTAPIPTPVHPPPAPQLMFNPSRKFPSVQGKEAKPGITPNSTTAAQEKTYPTEKSSATAIPVKSLLVEPATDSPFFFPLPPARSTRKQALLRGIHKSEEQISAQGTSLASQEIGEDISQVRTQVIEDESEPRESPGVKERPYSLRSITASTKQQSLLPGSAEVSQRSEETLASGETTRLDYMK
ncbi:hypothetical protein KEM55_001534 [Ascosphaera atra]|nr:hypothetical protein KEM55_001534 [Ascosphaera atra]